VRRAYSPSVPHPALRMCQKMTKVEPCPPSTLWEDLWSIVIWFANLFLPTLKGTHACKPTMPAVIPTVIAELKTVIGKTDTKWTFVDLGCGQGTMLNPMRNATIDGKNIFERAVGVELDPRTHREAVAATKDDAAIEVVCGDMFPFVEKACAGAKIFGGSAAFYLYEPLWMAGLSKEEMDRMYAGLLSQVAKHPGSIIAYCAADSTREVPTTLLEASGMVLKRATLVAQNGVFNKLRGRYNTLELWQVP